MGWRSSGLMRLACAAARAHRSSSGPSPSSGAPVPSMMRPSNPGPTRTLPARCRGITRALGVEAVHVARRHHEQLVAGEADDFGLAARAVTGNDDRRRSPTAAWQPDASSVSPTMRVSEPSTGGDGRFAARATCMSMLLRQVSERSVRNAFVALMPGPRLPADRSRRRPRRRARHDRRRAGHASPRRSSTRRGRRCSHCPWSRGSRRAP